MESTQPDKTRSISTFTELPERESAQLFERFRKVSLKISDKIFPLPFLYGVTTELYDLETRQWIGVVHNLICRLPLLRWGYSDCHEYKAEAERSQPPNRIPPGFHLSIHNRL